MIENSTIIKKSLRKIKTKKNEFETFEVSSTITRSRKKKKTRKTSTLNVTKNEKKNELNINN